MDKGEGTRVDPRVKSLPLHCGAMAHAATAPSNPAGRPGAPAQAASAAQAQGLFLPLQAPAVTSWQVTGAGSSLGSQGLVCP